MASPSNVRDNRSERQCVAHRVLVRRAQAILASSLSAPHSLAVVARALDTSPFHLAHVFQAEVGMPLHQYLVRLRLTAALDALSGGANNLSRLALELGFSHHSHFTAAFRRAFGHTPSEARRKLTEGATSTRGASEMELQSA